MCSDVLTYIVCFISPRRLKNFCLGFLQNMTQYKNIKWDTYTKVWHKYLLYGFQGPRIFKFDECYVRRWLPKIEAIYNDGEDFMGLDFIHSDIVLRCLRIGLDNVVQELMESDFKLPFMFCMTALEVAVEYNRQRIVRIIIDKYLQHPYIHDLIAKACEKGFTEIVAMLLKEYPFIRVPGRCFSFAQSAEMMKLLLGAAKNGDEEELYLALYANIARGDLQLTQLLLDCDRLHLDDEDERPLELACANDDTTMIGLLMKHDKIIKCRTKKNLDDVYNAFNRKLKDLKRVPKMKAQPLKRMLNIIESFTDNDVEENKEALEQVYEALKKKLKPADLEEEEENSEETLKQYILDNWKNCKRLRTKIEWEGRDYFYDSYTTVPVSWETYSQFARSDDCVCGECEKK